MSALRLVIALSVALLLWADPARAEEEAMSCAVYMEGPTLRRNRITGTFLWLYLKKNESKGAMNPHLAGTIIAMVDRVREGIEDDCRREGGDVARHAAANIAILNEALSATFSE